MILVNQYVNGERQPRVQFAERENAIKYIQSRVAGLELADKPQGRKRGRTEQVLAVTTSGEEFQFDMFTKVGK